MIEFKKWAVPINFEGVDLSPIAICIDHLGMHGNLPNLSEESSIWLWRFTICIGCVCSDNAENIKRVVNEVLQLSNIYREHLLESVSKRFDGDFTEKHLDLWINDLKKILELCNEKTICSWKCAS